MKFLFNWCNLFSYFSTVCFWATCDKTFVHLLVVIFLTSFVWTTILYLIAKRPLRSEKSIEKENSPKEMEHVIIKEKLKDLVDKL